MAIKRRAMLLRTATLAGLLIASILLRADVGSTGDLSVGQYRMTLQQLQTATNQLDSSGGPIPPALQDLPQNWNIHTDQQRFSISTDALRSDIRAYDQDRKIANATAIRARLQSLSDDIEGFQADPTDASSPRQHLTAVLARPEFRDVHGPTFLELLQHKLMNAILHILEAAFGSSAVPMISQLLIYGLIGFALISLGFLAFRHIRSTTEEEIALTSQELSVSAKGWALWLDEARAAAAQHNWREAVHLAYWGGISFMEQQGAWRPDRARTPREYLRLLSNTSEHRETLTALTRIFELTWYANHRADAGVFSVTLEALEKLGCRAQ